FVHFCLSLCCVHAQLSSLSLHDALPISDQTVWFSDSGRCRRRLVLRAAAAHPCQERMRVVLRIAQGRGDAIEVDRDDHHAESGLDRKSTRLNSSHVSNSYAVFCLKEKIQ